MSQNEMKDRISDMNNSGETPKQRRIILVILIDLLVLTVCLLSFAVYYFFPQTYEKTVSSSGEDSANSESIVSTDTGGGLIQKPAGSEVGDFSLKFADKFITGQAVSSEDSYRSGNVSITLRQVQETGVTYYVQDIYVRSTKNLRTAFAEDTYGKAITDTVLGMAMENKAIGAINGDYYGVENSGVVIRNGVLYRAEADSDVLVLFKDGTMRVYEEDVFDGEAAMAEGAYQAWCFGPSLLEEGEAIDRFSSRIGGANPRTMIGYFEPGHYCFVTVDGRQEGYSSGMTLVELSQLAEDLGCEVAYNLDGGKTSTMTFGEDIVNQPVSGGRKTSDIIFITE